MDLNGKWSDGVRYILREEKDIVDAFSLSDNEILSNPRYKAVWNNTWRGHSDFGYKTGDFDYTTLDHDIITSPYNVITGTNRHFRPLKGVNGSELLVNLAMRSGDVNRFEQAMHMGQDYFSHYNKGFRTWGGPGGMGHALARTAPDNPYNSSGGLSNAYKAADKWMRQKEELWYLIWDNDKWLQM